MKQNAQFCFTQKQQKINKTNKNMTILKIIGENGVMPQLCRGGACPAAIIADNDNVFVQGFVLAPAEGAALTAPAGEGFVRMPRATFEKIARQVLAA